jgi:hypothetical protein
LILHKWIVIFKDVIIIIISHNQDLQVHHHQSLTSVHRKSIWHYQVSNTQMTKWWPKEYRLCGLKKHPLIINMYIWFIPCLWRRTLLILWSSYLDSLTFGTDVVISPTLNLIPCIN